MGLGLAIVERAAAVLGHPLGLRSAPGCGSTFSVGLQPVAGPVPRPEGAAVSVEARDMETRDLLVLLVENDAALAGAMVQLLEKWGVTVLDVASGEEALELIDATGVEPDICLIDFQLGDGIDGLDCLSGLRARLGDVPAMGAQIMAKPIPPSELAAVLFGRQRRG